MNEKTKEKDNVKIVKDQHAVFPPATHCGSLCSV
jgi:hypothetical protein